MIRRNQFLTSICHVIYAQHFEITLKVSNKIVSSAGPCCKRSLLYKHDDDVRQEMFAIEFIKACDSILKSCGLDLKLITFQCIPVGENKGFIEWVHGSVPLSEICQPFAYSFMLTTYVCLFPDTFICLTLPSIPIKNVPLIYSGK